MTTIKGGQIKALVDGTSTVLMSPQEITMTAESEQVILEGMDVGVEGVVTLYAEESSTTYTLSISGQYISPRARDFFSFNLLERESKTRDFPGIVSIQTAASGNTTLTIPTGATLQEVQVTTIGKERILTETTDYTVTGTDITITSVNGERVSAVFTNSVTGNVASKAAPAANKATSTAVEISGILVYPNRTYEGIIIPSAVLTTKPEQIIAGDPSFTLEFTATEGTGTPFEYWSLDAAALTALGL